MRIVNVFHLLREIGEALHAFLSPGIERFIARPVRENMLTEGLEGETFRPRFASPGLERQVDVLNEIVGSDRLDVFIEPGPLEIEFAVLDERKGSY